MCSAARLLQSTEKIRGAVEVEGTGLNRRKMEFHHGDHVGVAVLRGEAESSREAFPRGMLQERNAGVQCRALKESSPGYEKGQLSGPQMSDI